MLKLHCNLSRTSLWKAPIKYPPWCTKPSRLCRCLLTSRADRPHPSASNLLPCGVCLLTGASHRAPPTAARGASRLFGRGRSCCRRATTDVDMKKTHAQGSSRPTNASPHTRWNDEAHQAPANTNEGQSGGGAVGKVLVGTALIHDLCDSWHFVACVTIHAC